MRGMEKNFRANSADTHHNETIGSGQPAARQRPNWRAWAAGTTLALAVMIATAVLSPWVRHEWLLSLGRQKTSYTELGFKDAAALPTTATDEEDIPVVFTVKNDGSNPVSYRYVIAAGSDSRLTALVSSSIQVTPDTVGTVSRIIVPNCPLTICRVRVSLPQQRESIDFIFTIRNPASNEKKSNGS
jgi:hypothetical protein